jgi:lysophospholipase L1-like esterase
MTDNEKLLSFGGPSPLQKYGANDFFLEKLALSLSGTNQDSGAVAAKERSGLIPTWLYRLPINGLLPGVNGLGARDGMTAAEVTLSGAAITIDAVGIPSTVPPSMTVNTSTAYVDNITIELTIRLDTIGAGASIGLNMVGASAGFARNSRATFDLQTSQMLLWVNGYEFDEQQGGAPTLAQGDIVTLRLNYSGGNWLYHLVRGGEVYLVRGDNTTLFDNPSTGQGMCYPGFILDGVVATILDFGYYTFDQPGAKLLLLGDSLAKGWFTNYPNSIAGKLNAQTNHRVQVQASPGSRLVDFAAGIRETWAMRPKNCLVWVGHNDLFAGRTLAAIRQDYEAFVSLLQLNQITPIGVKLAPSGWVGNQRIKDWNVIVEQVFEQKPILDLFNSDLTIGDGGRNPVYYADANNGYVHYNAAGNQLIADKIKTGLSTWSIS